jgi:hypothetical protein
MPEVAPPLSPSVQRRAKWRAAGWIVAAIVCLPLDLVVLLRLPGNRSVASHAFRAVVAARSIQHPAVSMTAVPVHVDSLETARILRLHTKDGDGEECPYGEVKVPWLRRRAILQPTKIAVYGTAPHLVIAFETRVIWSSTWSAAPGLDVFVDGETGLVVVERRRS